MARATTDGKRERVIYELQDDGTWTARAASSRSLSAEGGSVAQARKRVRAVLRADRARRRVRSLEVVDEIRLPAAGLEAVQQVMRAREALEAAEREAVTVLVRRFGLGTREASGALQMPARRVVRLAGEVADAEAEAKSARRARRGVVARSRAIGR